MIPEFDDRGYLPSGIHPATLDEVAARFGRESEIRQAEMESLTWLVDLARRAGAKRLVINGSFTTDTLEPNDVDCVVLVAAGYPLDQEAADELNEGLPFLQLQIVPLEDFDWLTGFFFASDGEMTPKGMVEVTP